MTFRLQKVDELSIEDHYHLVDGDECWYFGEYTAYKDWSFSPTNQLIKNFKKKVSLKGTAQWPYKQKAIRQVGNLLASVINPNSLNGIVFVPIPPSKINTDPEYDPRMLDALNMASKKLEVQLPICECITQTQSMAPDHESDNGRLYPEERAATYYLHQNRIPEGTNRIVFVDDMLTTGSHFKGAEIAVKAGLPDVQITGLFVSRRIHENPFEEVDLSDLF